MDVLTHGLAGGLVALASARRRPAWAVGAAVAGALAPDVDAVARLWDPLAPITVHRTATHSLVGGLLLALLVAAALKAARAPGSWLALTAFAYGGVLSHVGLDALNPVGTAVLWPFDSRRVGLGWLYVIDPVLFTVALTGWLVAWRRSALRSYAARAAVVAVAVYAVVAGGLSRAADVEFRRLLAQRGGDASPAVVVPIFPGPLRWMGVAKTGAGVSQLRFWLGRSDGATVSIVPTTGPSPDPSLEALPAVRAFRAVARVPVGSVRAEANGSVVEYRDWAFEDHPGGGPLALRLRLDASGAVRQVEVGHRF